MRSYTLEDLCRMIDHTNLHADATEADMEKLCDEAARYGFGMVAINQSQVKLCAELLAETDVHVGAAISFPLGQTTIYSKVTDTRDALDNGADEIDYVTNLTEVKAGNWDYVEEEMASIVALCREEGAISKVIFENCYLSQDEKLGMCEVASRVRPDFVKTSTGFGKGGATFDDIRLMRANVPPEVKVKAAGGIRTADDFLEYVRLGAERIGCSAGIPIIDELRHRMELQGLDVLEL